MRMNRGFDVVIIDEAAQAVRIIHLLIFFILEFESTSNNISCYV